MVSGAWPTSPVIHPARTHGQASLRIAEELGDPWLVAVAAVHLLGIAAYIDGDYAASRAFYERSLAIRGELGYQEGIGILLSLLGIVAIRERNFASAHAYFAEALATMRGILSDWGMSINVATFAGLAAQGQLVEAVRLAGAATSLREAWHTPLIPLIERVVDEALAEARQKLDPTVYAAAWAEGQAMSLEESLAAAQAVEIRPPEPWDSAGLTAAEARVLRLLARGLTTREVAAELVIAISTVDRHITHIYTKLGLRNRAEAVAYALTHGLT